MAGSPISICYPALNGVNMTDEPVSFDARLAGNFLQWTVNLKIEANRWRTANRTVEFQAVGDADTLATWRAGNTQAAQWYLPRSGQGVDYIGKGLPRIIESSAGKMFTLEPRNRMFQVKDVSGGMTATPTVMLAWLCQGENYMVRTDGKSQTQIYDGSGVVFGTPGYNSNVKEDARFPNQAGPTVYAGGQFWTTLFGRRIYVSNSLHELNQVNASDLLKFSDQTYDYINVYFAPPADDGDIVALTTSNNSGYQDSRAQGEVLAMCNGPSIWGVTLGIPRTSWPQAQMRHSRSLEAAATGPNAFFVRDGDIIMRTSKGIESINLMARQINTLGNPSLNLGADLQPLLMADYEPDLLYASVANPPRWDRLFCTVYPITKEARHYHLGWITANWNPQNSRIPQGFAWEGLTTLPYAMGRVIQFLFARIDGKSRLFALLDKADGTDKGLAEITLEEGHNVLADGTEVPIEWQMMTKRLMGSSQFAASGWSTMYLWLDQITTDVTVQIYARSNVTPDFQMLLDLSVCPLDADDAVLGCGKNAERLIPLGKALSEFSNAQWIQVLIIGTGVCSPNLGIQADEASSPQTTGEDLSEPLPAASRSVCQFNPFGYALPAQQSLVDETCELS